MLTFIDILTNFDILRQPYTKINVKHRNFYMFNLSDICAFLKVDYIKHQPRVRKVTKCPKILLWRLWTLFWDKFALCLFVMVPHPPPLPDQPSPRLQETSIDDQFNRLNQRKYKKEKPTQIPWVMTYNQTLPNIKKIFKWQLELAKN